MARRQEADTQDLLGVAARPSGFDADTGLLAGPRLRVQSEKAAAGMLEVHMRLGFLAGTP